MEVLVCIGSSCHLKGSRQVVETLQRLVEERSLKDKVKLAGKFCMGNCQNGVSVMVDGRLCSVKPQETEAFFEREIVNGLR